MLIGVDDVETGVGEEAADGRDQPRAIGAGEQESGCVLLGDPRIMPVNGPWTREFPLSRRIG
jgi:hypothetical protein